MVFHSIMYIELAMFLFHTRAQLFFEHKEAGMNFNSKSFFKFILIILAFEFSSFCKKQMPLRMRNYYVYSNDPMVYSCLIPNCG